MHACPVTMTANDVMAANDYVFETHKCDLAMTHCKKKKKKKGLVQFILVPGYTTTWTAKGYSPLVLI